MMQVMRKMEVMFRALTALAMLMLLIVMSQLFGGVIERNIYPVIDQEEFRQQQFRHFDGALWVDLWVTKLRDCSFVSQSFLVGDDARGWRRVYYTRPGTEPGATRPIGLQTFGWYRFETENAQACDWVKGVIRYECHQMWLVTHDLGPWRVDNKRDCSRSDQPHP